MRGTKLIFHGVQADIEILTEELTCPACGLSVSDFEIISTGDSYQITLLKATIDQPAVTEILTRWKVELP